MANDVTYDASLFEVKKKEPEKRYSHVNLERHKRGNIILPDRMPIAKAISWLKKMERDEQTLVNFYREFDFHPDDGAVGLAAVLKEVFGWQELKAERSFFGDILPTMVQVKTGVGTHITVPWGRMALPGVEGFIQTSVKVEDREEMEREYGEDVDCTPKFVIRGEIWKRDTQKCEVICDLLEEYVRQHSIFRGAAFTSKRDFIDLGSTSIDDLIFGPTTLAQIETSIFTPIIKTEAVRQAKIPLKRGVLLEGPYGTGKTLTAYVTAKHAVIHGWTFILVHGKDSLNKALQFAKQYEPAVVFMEDIDNGVGGQTRTERINTVLNTIDGIITKTSELMVILTTNHVERINKAMLRPGRLDAIVHVGPPEPEAIERLIRKYGRDLVPEDEDLAPVVEACLGMIPATIREVVERSKLFTISRTGQAKVVQALDLIESAKQMKHHVNLMEPETDEKGEVRLLATWKGDKGEMATAGKKVAEEDE
jgi:transitional endoplasmic reticulum ATPase